MSENERLRQSIIENGNLMVNKNFWFIPLEVSVDDLTDDATKKGYLISLLKGTQSNDGSGVFIIHRPGEKPVGKLADLCLFDMRGGLGLNGLYIGAWNFNRFKEIFLGKEGTV